MQYDSSFISSSSDTEEEKGEEEKKEDSYILNVFLCCSEIYLNTQVKAKFAISINNFNEYNEEDTRKKCNKLNLQYSIR